MGEVTGFCFLWKGRVTSLTGKEMGRATNLFGEKWKIPSHTQLKAHLPLLNKMYHIKFPITISPVSDFILRVET